MFPKQAAADKLGAQHFNQKVHWTSHANQAEVQAAFGEISTEKSCHHSERNPSERNPSEGSCSSPESAATLPVSAVLADPRQLRRKGSPLKNTAATHKMQQSASRTTCDLGVLQAVIVFLFND